MAMDLAQNVGWFPDSYKGGMLMFRHQLLAKILARASCAAALCLAGSWSHVALADAPIVQFDVAPMVGCRDVTTASFMQSNPDERLVEARFLISSLIQRGEEKDLNEFVYFIDSPRQSMTVEDYLPKTTLATDVVGSVCVEERQDRTRTFGLSGVGEVTGDIKVTANANSATTNGERMQYERLPPLELVSASGTMRRGTAAYFKLKPSTRSSLEGSKEFVLILRVPAKWRGDYVRITCTALGTNRGMVRHLDEEVKCGRGEFSVALYAEGDMDAKQVAAMHVEREREFRSTVSASHKLIQKHQSPNPARKFGQWLSVVEPSPPDAWFETILRNPAGENVDRYAKQLPANVRMAATSYQKSRQQLQKLSGQ
jgi:hypothetical protein